MYLHAVDLSSYRAFGAAALALEPAGVTLIIGANNSGKSSLLSAIDAIRGIGIPHPIQNTTIGVPARIIATFGLSEDERLEVLAEGRLEWQMPDILTDVRVTMDQLPSGIFAVTTLEIASGAGRFATIGTFKTSGQNQEIQTLNVLTHIREQTPSDPVSLTASASGNGLERHLLNSDIAGIRGIQSAILQWMAAVYHFESLRPGTSRARPSSGSDRLSPSGENLPEVLLALATGESNEWRQIRAAMSELVPDAGTLLTPVRGGEVEVVFEDESGIRRNLQDLGTGVEQILMTAVVGITHDPGGLVMIEEPETNLHPGAQRSLLRRLEEWAGSRQIIATTHSTVFLDRVTDADTRVWLVERERAISSLRRIVADQGVLAELGVRLSDVLAAERLLLVEGKSDVDILEEWFRDLLRRSSIEVIALRGSDAARGTERFEVLAGVGREFKRVVLFLRDRDELSPSAIDHLEQGGRVRVLPVREIENLFLSDPSAVHAALAARARPASISIDVESQLEAIAGDYQQKVILRRVVTRLSPIYPAPWAAIRAHGTPSPTLDELLAIIDDSLARVGGVRELAEHTWYEEEIDVHARWRTDWRDIVPASELLNDLWRSHGLNYDKSRDGVGIANRMDAPEVLRSEVERLAARSMET
jgi:predicted ATPase